MLQNFIKVVWAAGIIQSLRKVLVYASVANRSYQGTIQNLNDEVEILTISDPTIKSYTANTDIDSPEDIMDAAKRLKIDQAYYFNFKANDVEAIQAKPALLRQATDKASYKFRDQVDQFFAGLYAQSKYTSYSTGTTPWSVNSANVEDVILDVKEQMTKNNIPEANRFMIIPAWMHTKLILAGLTTKTNNDILFQNGMIDYIFGFQMMLSNNVSEASADTNCKIICGIKNESFSFADSVNKIEAYRPEKRFEDAVKGLYIFGGKCLRPDMTLTMYASKAAEA